MLNCPMCHWEGPSQAWPDFAHHLKEKHGWTYQQIGRAFITAEGLHAAVGQLVVEMKRRTEYGTHD